MMKLLKNSKGLSIIEVLVAAGIGTIVSLGIATMMQNSMTEQKRIQLYATLKDIKIRTQMLLQDPSSWSATFNGAQAAGGATTLFNAIKNNTAVTEVALTSPVQIKIYDASGTVAMNLFGPISATPYSGNGFTISGGACTTFTSAGNDECPISYKLLIAAQCATGSSCTNPQLYIVGKLLYSPKPGGILDKFTGPLGLDSATNNDITSIVNPPTGKRPSYAIFMMRTSTQINRYFKIASQVTSSVTGCVSSGAGQCSHASPYGAIHPNTNGTTGSWVLSDNPYGLVTTTGVTYPGSFRFTATGTYSCMITVPAFATDGFKASLCQRNSAANCDVVVASAVTTAGKWALSNAVMQAKFNVSDTNKDYGIFQYCDTSSPGGTPSADLCTLGMQTAPYSGSVDIVSVNCNIIDTDTM